MQMYHLIQSNEQKYFTTKLFRIHFMYNEKFVPIYFLMELFFDILLKAEPKFGHSRFGL